MWSPAHESKTSVWLGYNIISQQVIAIDPQGKKLSTYVATPKIIAR